jgi:hypothetical protein
MTENRTLISLYRALEEANDPVALLALADFYEEQGNLQPANCLRWTVDQGRFPFQYQARCLRVHSGNWHDGWWWWARPRPRNTWGHPSTCELPVPLWNKLRHSFDYDAPWLFKEYKTLRDAYEALFSVWDEAVLDEEEFLP